MTKKLAIFGSTGSIGTQTLELLRMFPGKFEVTALTALKNKEQLEKQAKEFEAKQNGESIQTALGEHPDLSLVDNADIVINALPGFAGLEVSIAALKKGKTLLSANKESLAIAGKQLRDLAQKHEAKIYPLDSEASAVWQLMHEHGVEQHINESPFGKSPDTLSQEEKAKTLSSITLTCSGGPFFGKKNEELKDVTVEQALDHPTWKMGPKVSLDSATLINKVLEVYETHNIFDIPLKDIHIVIHRQSHVHSMIHTKSGAKKMHLSQNDMKLFISYALHYPVQPKWPGGIERMKKSELSFEQPDKETFRSVAWLELHRGNPNFPIVLNAMNDVATQKFLKGELKFLEIYDFIEAGFEKWIYKKPPLTLETLIAFHEKVSDWAKTFTITQATHI